MGCICMQVGLFQKSTEAGKLLISSLTSKLGIINLRLLAENHFSPSRQFSFQYQQVSHMSCERKILLLNLWNIKIYSRGRL